VRDINSAGGVVFVLGRERGGTVVKLPDYRMSISLFYNQAYESCCRYDVRCFVSRKKKGGAITV
jgi:hypothetical protein